MRQIEKEGYTWARLGLMTQESAAAYIKKYQRSREAMPRMMRLLRLGDRPPAPSEEKYLLGVLSPLVRGPGERRRRVPPRRLSRQRNQPLAGQDPQGPAEPVPVPAQLGADLLVVGAPPVFQHGDIEQRRVPVPAADEPPGRRAGEDDAFLLRQVQNILADGRPLLRSLVVFLLFYMKRRRS